MRMCISDSVVLSGAVLFEGYDRDSVSAITKYFPGVYSILQHQVTSRASVCEAVVVVTSVERRSTIIPPANRTEATEMQR